MHVNELLLPQISLAKKFLFSFFCLSVMAVAEAGPITAPSELQAGDTFRLIFVTSGTINATSSDISVYDRFVNQQAGVRLTMGPEFISPQLLRLPQRQPVHQR